MTSAPRERAPRPPLLAEPAEQRPGHDAADEHEALARDEAAQGRHRQMGVLDGAERHHRVAEQRGVRAGETDQRRAARVPLRRTGHEREDDPGRREQADVARPAGGPDVSGAQQAAEVLVAGAERCRNDECENDPHERDRTREPHVDSGR